MGNVTLTQMSVGYDGKPQRMEVSAFTKGIHDRAGVYLQKVEGCGYTVFDLTVAEAFKLGTMLINAAQKTVEEFSEVV